MVKLGEDLGRLLLRWAVGGLMLFHGVFKLTHGIDFITGMLQQAGLPTFLAFGVYLGEVVAPVLLLLGLWSRAAGVMVVCDMVVALALTQGAQAFSISERGGALSSELEALYLFGGLAIVFLGSGSFSVSRGKGLWN